MVGPQEVVSLGVRRAADLRPTFLQVNDISDFGTLEAVAALLVPPGATLLSSTSATHIAPSPTAAADDVPLDRTYFTYEFSRGALHGCLVAASKYGKASTPKRGRFGLLLLSCCQGTLAATLCADVVVRPAQTYVLLASNASPQFDDAAAARLRAIAASFRVVG